MKSPRIILGRIVATIHQTLGDLTWSRLRDWLDPIQWRFQKFVDRLCLIFGKFDPAVARDRQYPVYLKPQPRVFVLNRLDRVMQTLDLSTLPTVGRADAGEEIEEEIIEEPGDLLEEVTEPTPEHERGTGDVHTRRETRAGRARFATQIGVASLAATARRHRTVVRRHYPRSRIQPRR